MPRDGQYVSEPLASTCTYACPVRNVSRDTQPGYVARIRNKPQHCFLVSESLARNGGVRPTPIVSLLTGREKCSRSGSSTGIRPTPIRRGQEPIGQPRKF